jgi:hypothetical protein
MALAGELPGKQARAAAQIQHRQRSRADLGIVEPVIVVGSVQPVIEADEPAISILGILHHRASRAEARTQI